MKRKGFTLIELLAVIIILAVIALIAVPVVLNVVESAKKSSFESSAYGIVDTIKLQYSEGILDGSNGAKIYDFSTTTDIDNKFSGEKPQGIAKVDEDGRIEMAIHNGKWCAIKGLNEGTVTLIDYDEATCLLDNAAPTVQLTTPVVIKAENIPNIQGEQIEKATSYTLLEKNEDGTYVAQATSNSIDFDISTLNLEAGEHTFVVQAKAGGYIDSEYSNELIYMVYSITLETDENYSYPDTNPTTIVESGTATVTFTRTDTSIGWSVGGENVVLNINGEIDGYTCAIILTEPTGEVRVRMKKSSGTPTHSG